MKIANIEVTLLGSYGDDLNVVNAARVSMHKESEWATNWAGDKDGLTDKDAKLIKYLADHKHHSPFNHSFLSFRIKAPTFVARQLQKHKFMPWNEVSRRYVDDEPEFYFPDFWRKRADNVKQGSSDEPVDQRAISKVLYIETYWDEPGNYDGRGYGYDNVAELCLNAYNDLLGVGVCPEQARMVLPQNMMTEWIWSGTLGAFLDMLVLRLDSHTQQETQEVAKLVATEVKKLFPVSYEAYLGEGV